MTGEQMLAKIIDLLELYPGVRWFHSYDARRDKMPGMPDLIIAGPGGVMFRECKGPAEELRGPQLAWRRMFQAADADYDVWRPADWNAGRIKTQIMNIAGYDVAA